MRHTYLLFSMAKSLFNGVTNMFCFGRFMSRPTKTHTQTHYTSVKKKDSLKNSLAKRKSWKAYLFRKALEYQNLDIVMSMYLNKNKSFMNFIGIENHTGPPIVSVACTTTIIPIYAHETVHAWSTIR